VDTDNRDTVLIVDDEIINIELISNLLEEKYIILSADNGKDAIKSANKNHPDLILLDILMPDMDGYTICQKLKRNASTNSIPIIFLTSKNKDKDEAKGFLLGAVDYIKKPFRPLVDMKRVAVHIKLARQKKQGFQIEKKNIGNFFDLEDEIKDIYSLTNSEARLCNNLLNGLSLEETAEKTSLKYSTLKGYLKTILWLSLFILEDKQLD